MLVATQIYSSLGIGLLVGLLLGLSSAPVVGLVVGSVTALLAGLLGVAVPSRDAQQAPVPREQQQALIGLRAGTFGLACIVGMFAGITMRTYNVLSPPEPGLREHYEELMAIGFSAERARELAVAAPATGVVGVDDAGPTTRDTVLFSVDSETCQQLAIDRFGTLSAAADYYETKGFDRLARITRELEQNIDDDSERRAAMGAVLEILCETD
jgi:hypothetical protein